MERMHEARGRTIDRIAPVEERFTKLEEGRDYDIVTKNPYVESDHRIQDFAYFINSSGEEKRTVEAPHWRTMTVENVTSTARLPFAKGGAKPVPYFAVSTKGIGYTQPSALGKTLDASYETWTVPDPNNENDPPGYKVLGLASKKEFYFYRDENIVDRSIFLTSQGLRTELYWGVEKLKNLYFQGKLHSLKQLRDEGVIPGGRYVPHMAQRLLKSNTRLEQIYGTSDVARREALIERAFHSHNLETAFTGEHALESTSTPDQREFLARFARNIGNNLAVLLNTGYIHTAAHTSNITVAGELVDVTPMNHYSELVRLENGFEEVHESRSLGPLRLGHIKDIRDMARGAKMFRKGIREMGVAAPDRDAYVGAMMLGFDEAYEPIKVAREGSDPESAKKWVHEILKALIEEGDNLPALAHHGMDAWPQRFR